MDKKKLSACFTALPVSPPLKPETISWLDQSSDRYHWHVHVPTRPLCGTVFFILPTPAEFLTITARTRNMCVTLPPAPAMCMSTPARTCKTLRIYACTIIEMHWFCVFSCPAGENTSFYRLLIKRLMGLFVSFSWAACLLTHWSGIATYFVVFIQFLMK